MSTDEYYCKSCDVKTDKAWCHKPHCQAVKITPHPSDSDILSDEVIRDQIIKQGSWEAEGDCMEIAKWMRDRMNGEIAYWKEVALNPDCICERTTEIDKCPVHSTGPEK